MFLAGDIGGTKTALGLFEVRENRLVSIVEETYPSRDYPNLEAIAGEFLQSRRAQVQSACFGVAGPVDNGRCVGVNMPWVVDAATVADGARIPRVQVINDLEATAYSLTALAAKDLVPLMPGSAGAVGNRAVVAAGTGLGEAGLYWDGQRHWPFACEGGHSDFGARDALDANLLKFLLTRYSHISAERVVCGQGLVDVYDFFRQAEPAQANSAVAEEMQHEDAAAVVSRAGLQRRCPICEKALDYFVTIYGAEAGNLALKLMAKGGVYVGGGIAPKIVDKLRGPGFREAFAAKGRMRYFMEAIPVYVILTNRAALIGAAEFARLQS